MPSNLLMLWPDLIRRGVFEHAILPGLHAPFFLGDEASSGDLPAVIETCRTRLPANFCTCGRYMLFAPEEEGHDAV